MHLRYDGNVGIGTTSPSTRLTVSDTGPAIVDIHHSDGGTGDEARIILGALSANPPSNRGAGIAALNNGAGHDLLIKTSPTHGLSPTEKVRVTSAGLVGIGKNNPQHPLHLQTSSTAASGPIIGFANTDSGLDQDQAIGGFEFTKSDSSGAGGGLCGSIKVRSDDSFGARTYIAFRTRSNSTGQAATDTEQLRIMAQGGITFNGDTSYDNALDDYEEGTWTPTSRDGSVTASKAFYTKIGRQVTLHCRLESFTDTSTNDQLTIQGIPFAVVADKSDIAHGSARYQNISETNNTVCFITHARQGFNFSGGDSGAFSQIRYNELNSNSRIDLIATYFTG